MGFTSLTLWALISELLGSRDHQIDVFRSLKVGSPPLPPILLFFPYSFNNAEVAGQTACSNHQVVPSPGVEERDDEST